MWKGWALAMGGPLRYRLTMLGVRMGVRMAKFLPWHPGKLGAWTRGRELPKVPGPAFRQLVGRTSGSEDVKPSDSPA